MNIAFSANELRVLGCLIEKSITTPDQYPLSLNALTLACNQKSNRDPMMELSDSDVQWVVDALARKHFVMEKSGFGSRVPKYQQRFCNTDYGALKFSPQELAILCELMLRGPQTPGELRTRASRMAPFADAAVVEATLAGLQDRADGSFVVRLPREPGRRDSRYAHRFAEYAESVDAPADAPAPAPTPGENRHPSANVGSTHSPAARGEAEWLQRIQDLEARVSALEQMLAARPADPA